MPSAEPLSTPQKAFRTCRMVERKYNVLKLALLVSVIILFAPIAPWSLFSSEREGLHAVQIQPQSEKPHVIQRPSQIHQDMPSILSVIIKKDPKVFEDGEIFCNIVGSSSDTPQYGMNDPDENTSWLEAYMEVLGIPKTETPDCAAKDCTKQATIGGHIVTKDKWVSPNVGENGLLLVPLCSDHNTESATKHPVIPSKPKITALTLDNFCRWGDPPKTCTTGRTSTSSQCGVKQTPMP